MAASHMGARNQTKVLGKSSQCSKLLGHLQPRFVVFLIFTYVRVLKKYVVYMWRLEKNFVETFLKTIKRLTNHHKDIK